MDIKLLQYLSINSALPPVTEIAKNKLPSFPPFSNKKALKNRQNENKI